MEIKVLFFGVLAEVTGTAFRNYSGVKNTSDLQHRIADDYPEIVHYNFRIAVNSQIINDETDLCENDEVAYLPPFAGG